MARAHSRIAAYFVAVLVATIVVVGTGTIEVHAKEKVDEGPIIQPGDGDDIGGFKEPEFHDEDGERPPTITAGRPGTQSEKLIFVRHLPFVLFWLIGPR